MGRAGGFALVSTWGAQSWLCFRAPGFGVFFTTLCFRLCWFLGSALLSLSHAVHGSRPMLDVQRPVLNPGPYTYIASRCFGKSHRVHFRRTMSYPGNTHCPRLESPVAPKTKDCPVDQFQGNVVATKKTGQIAPSYPDSKFDPEPS